MVCARAKMAAPIKLVHAPLCWDSVAWSDDNRLAIATTGCVNVFALQCDPPERSLDPMFIKSVIKSRPETMVFDVGFTMKKLDEEEEKHYMVQSLQMDRTLTPHHHRGSQIDTDIDRTAFKLVRWSPAGNSPFDRTLLACLTLDHRLTIHRRIAKKGTLTLVVDLSKLLNKIVKQQQFCHANEPPAPDLPANPTLETRCAEFKRRVYMLAAVAMDWSSIFTTPGTMDGQNNQAFVLLAVAMKSGHVLVWKFKTSSVNESDVNLHRVFDCGYQCAVSLAWCRLAHGTSEEKTACLAVGDREGCISLWQHSEREDVNKLQKCLDVWPSKDLISVTDVAWTSGIQTGVLDTTATLVVAKGLFLMTFLVDLGNMTIINQYHIPCQHTVPTTSLCVFGHTVYTSSTNGAVHKFTIDWTNSDEILKFDVHVPQVLNNKSFGIALSPNGIFIACPMMLRQSNKRPQARSLHIHVVGKADSAVSKLLELKGYLSQKTDLLELVRQRPDSNIAFLLRELDGITNVKLQLAANDENGTCKKALRLKRFAMQVQVCRLREMNRGSETENYKEQMQKLEGDVKETEIELTKLHIISALKSWQKESTNKPETTGNTDSHTTSLLLMADWLSTCSGSSEEPIKRLVSEVYSSIPQSTEIGQREPCDLCSKIIPLTSTTSDSCLNGHGWMRCRLSLRLCQTTSTPRVCLHCDALAFPVEETDSEWLTGVLQQRCLFCESVFVPP